MDERPDPAAWAQRVIGEHVDAAGAAITAFCEKPRSVKRLHRTRKCLARLRSALEDLALLAGVAATFSQRIGRVHKRAGRVRDADVLLARVESYCEGASGQEREQLERLRKRLRKRARRMREKLMKEIER